MNDILNRLTVLLALAAFLIVAAVSMGTGVEPMVCLFRATVALVFFGFFGRIGIRIILKGILEELARHKKAEKQKEAAQTEANMPAASAAETQSGTAETE